VGVLLTLCVVMRAKWPKGYVKWIHCAIVGLLVHGVYLGGVFSAMYRNIDAGLSSLIVGLQPLLTVLIAYIWLRESLTKNNMLGLCLGFAGISLVLFQDGINFSGLNPYGLGFCFAGLIGIVTGTLYQKRFCTEIELLPATCIQFVAACAFAAPLAFYTESMQIKWTIEFLFIVVWLVIVLSIGAVMLLWWLIRHGDAGRVSTYFYLVPPVVAIQAWFLFEEHLTLATLLGMTMCIFGVWMVQGRGTDLRK